MAEVFYRKWRPKSLSEVVGQDAITKTLRQAVAQGRIAHAYLFCGTRGTGKTSTARILAKAINCLSPQDGEPDNECQICVGINDARSLDLIEIDAASNRGIDDIRELSDKVRFSPNESRYKIYIIDEVHMLTEPAFNALLKTLEEPPAHAVFILATTEAHKVPLTIISRCQRYDFRRIPIEQMVAKLADISAHEGIEVSDDALHLVARIANGGLRDAENLLEQVAVSYGSPISEDDVRQLLGLGGDEMALELVGHVIGKSVKDGIATVNNASEQGTDLRQLLRGTLEYLRALLLIKTGAGASFGYSDEIMGQLNGLAADAPMEQLVRALKVFAGVSMRRDVASTLPLELAMVESATEPEPVVVAAAPPAYSAPRQPAPMRQTPTARPSQPQQGYRQPARPNYQQPAARAGAPGGTPGGQHASSDDALSEPAARLSHQWDVIANDLRFVGTRLKLGAMLRSAREREVTGDTIILRYPSRSNVERMQQELDIPDSKRALYDAIANAMGSKYEVKVALSNGGNGASVRRASQASHLVQAAQAMGARVIGEREERQQ
jgi:DNA polymerase-3 subunit gamma/tau